MGKINVIGKWNLEKYQWQLNPNEKEVRMDNVIKH